MIAVESSSGVTPARVTGDMAIIAKRIVDAGQPVVSRSQDDVDQRDQLVRLERLGDEAVDGRLLGLGPVVALHGRRHHDDRDVLEAGIGADHADRPPAVAARHECVDGHDRPGKRIVLGVDDARARMLSASSPSWASITS